jgi:hypothetical protein
MHTIQYQKYERAIKSIKSSTLNNLGLKNGGTKETLELYRRAAVQYEDYIKAAKSAGDKSVGKV